MKKLISPLKKKNLTLSCAESLTAGMFSSTIASYPGVSSFFKGGVVTYWTEAKENVLHIPNELIKKYGVVSPECAQEMTRGVKRLFKSDISISFTGNAGPDVLEGKPVGLVYIGVGINDTMFTFEYHFEGTRNQIRRACVEEGIRKILELI